MKIEYEILKPSGNDTALVRGIDFSDKQKKIINDEIMKKHKNVEQVGFISNTSYELQMAGGEFCGNATRSAAFCYLKGKEGNIKIIVNKDKELNAGVTEEGKAWTEIPLYEKDDWIEKPSNGIYIVKMDGMRTIVIKPHIAENYLKQNKDLQSEGMRLIKDYKLENNKAVGVMICENVGEKIKIHPIVWVRDANTLFYETACGSGTTAVGIVQAYEKNNSAIMDIIQPSGMSITVKIKYSNNKIEKAIIEGEVLKDVKHYFLEF